MSMARLLLSAACLLVGAASKQVPPRETPFIVTKALDSLSLDISREDIADAEAERLTLQRRTQIEWVRLMAGWKMVHASWLWTTTIFWEKAIDVEQQARLNARADREPGGMNHAYHREMTRQIWVGLYRYFVGEVYDCLLYTSPSPRDRTRSRMPSSA